MKDRATTLVGNRRRRARWPTNRRSAARREIALCSSGRSARSGLIEAAMLCLAERLVSCDGGSRALSRLIRSRGAGWAGALRRQLGGGFVARRRGTPASASGGGGETIPTANIGFCKSAALPGFLGGGFFGGGCSASGDSRTSAACGGGTYTATATRTRAAGFIATVTWVGVAIRSMPVVAMIVDRPTS